MSWKPRLFSCMFGLSSIPLFLFSSPLLLAQGGCIAIGGQNNDYGLSIIQTSDGG